MDLLGLTSAAVGCVNPLQPVTLKLSSGYTVAGDGTQRPNYTTVDGVRGQVQPLTWRDLQQLDGTNQQGSQNAMYLEGHIQGISRPDSKGGDLVVMQDGSTWLVTQVLEFWPDWCKCAVTLQDGG